MRKMLQKLAGLAVAVTMMLTPVVTMLSTAPVWAVEVADPGAGGGTSGSDSKPVGETEGDADSDSKPDNPPETTILPNDMDIMGILKLVLNILVYGLGVAAVLGTVIAAIMYLTARDNEQQVAKAKTRLYEVVIGLVAWAVMWGLLQWLLPGGLQI